MTFISTKLDDARLADLARDPLWVPRPQLTEANRIAAQALRCELARQADEIGYRIDAAQDSFDSLRAAQAAHPRLAAARPLATAHLPCVSDADPAARDMPEELAEMLEQIAEARLSLDMAESMLEAGAEACELSARSLMNEAIEWLEPPL